MSYSTHSLPVTQPYRADTRHDGAVTAGRLSHNNVSPAGDGATEYNELYAGTILAKDSNGLLHPAGWQVCSAASATNTATVPDAGNFRVGDLVEVRSAVGVQDTVTIAAGDDPSDLTVTATVVGDIRRKIKLTDAGGVSDPLAFTVTDDAGDYLVDIQLSTDGGSAVDTTVAALAAYIDANKLAMGIVSGTQETPADLCQAVAATALAGGSDQYAGLASARSVTAVTATTVVFDGAAIDIVAGDHLLKTGAWQPAGFLDGNKATTEYRGTTAVSSARGCDVRTAGGVRTSTIIGSGDALKEAMSGGPYTSPQDGSIIVPEFEGFVFQDNV